MRPRVAASLLLLLGVLSLAACEGDGSPVVSPAPVAPRPPLVFAGTDDGTLWRIDSAQAEPRILRNEPLATPVGLAVDPVAGLLYWGDQNSRTLRRCRLDGSEGEVLPPAVEFVRGLALDPAAGRLYWCDDGNHANRIQRSDLDGGAVEDLVVYSTNVDLRQIALDPDRDWMYWTLSFEGRIERARLDGTGVETVVASASIRPCGIAVDPRDGSIYWTDYVANRIQRAAADGTGIEDFVTQGLRTPWTLALDPAGRFLYWMDLGTGRLQRRSLDGGRVEDVLTGLGGDKRSLALIAGPDS
jgi:low density lipoprotein receptor-related protein 5/6